MSSGLSFTDVCAQLEAALDGPFRAELVASLSRSKDLRHALTRLRDGLRAHAFKTPGHEIDLAAFVEPYDRRTRQDGFHALHDWDGKAECVNVETIPVDVLNFVADHRGDEPVNPAVLAILVDYYFLYVLGLMSLRVWDDGQPDENLARLDRLLADLQGPNGSGQPMAANAETLILIATAHYEPHEDGYQRLLVRARTLGTERRTSLALVHAQSMGSHLRFGFEATYGRDIVFMREDNVVDYPWVCFSVATLMTEYARMRDEDVQGVERERLVEAILHGLSTDPAAFVGDPPASLAASEAERTALVDLYAIHRSALLVEFELHRPSDAVYSPFSFFYNFCYNVVKGTVIDALLWGEPWTLGLNDLLTAMPRQAPRAEAKLKLANTLMRYAQASPDTIRGRSMPAIVYDAASGRRAYSLAMRTLKETPSPA